MHPCGPTKKGGSHTCKGAVQLPDREGPARRNTPPCLVHVIFSGRGLDGSVSYPYQPVRVYVNETGSYHHHVLAKAIDCIALKPAIQSMLKLSAHAS